jgi:hypothetical protein
MRSETHFVLLLNDLPINAVGHLLPEQAATHGIYERAKAAHDFRVYYRREAIN